MSSVNPADPQAHRGRAQSNPRRTVALIDLTLLALIAAASFAYWLVSGHAVYWPVLLFAGWSGIVQMVLRRPRSPQARRERRLRLENAAIGTLSALVLIAAVAIPLTKLLPL